LGGPRQGSTRLGDTRQGSTRLGDTRQGSTRLGDTWPCNTQLCDILWCASRKCNRRLNVLDSRVECIILFVFYKSLKVHDNQVECILLSAYYKIVAEELTLFFCLSSIGTSMCTAPTCRVASVVHRPVVIPSTRRHGTRLGWGKQGRESGLMSPFSSR